MGINNAKRVLVPRLCSFDPQVSPNLVMTHGKVFFVIVAIMLYANNYAG